MNPRLALLVFLAVAIVLILVYGKTYLWTHRAAQWSNAASRGHARRLTHGERVALGEPVRSLVITAIGLVLAFGAIALFRSQDPGLAWLGLACAVGVVVAVAAFVGRHRLPTLACAASLRGVLNRPPQDVRYVPRGAYLVGGMPVLYPLHWERFIEADIGREVEVSVTRHGAVVQHGATLSLEDEARTVGNAPWESTAAATTGLVALLVAALLFYGPLGEQFDAAKRAMQGHRLLVIDDGEAWRAWTPQVGDEISVSGVQADCALLATPGRAGAWVTGRTTTTTASGIYRCDEIAVGAPPSIQGGAGTAVAGIMADAENSPTGEPAREQALALSMAIEQMLATRRNATSEEVRAYWRQAGMGSSQRYTLASTPTVVGLVDALCRARSDGGARDGAQERVGNTVGNSPGACTAREMLRAAQDAPANRLSTAPDADAVVLDAADANRFAQAAYGLANEVLAPAIAKAMTEAAQRRQSASRVVQSLTGTPLASVPPLATGQGGGATAGQLPADSASPRIQWLRTQQALQSEGAHAVAFEGGVVTVDETSTPARVVVDTRITPSALWVMLAPLVALILLAILTACAVVATLYQRSRQRRRIRQIEAGYAERDTVTAG